MTLTEFLLARIAEDEEIARTVHRGPRWFIAEQPAARWGEDDLPDELLGGGKPLATFTDYGSTAIHHIIRHDPFRVLAECDAKRRIIQWCQLYADTVDIECGGDTARDLLSPLALPYADHPDYDEAWRPA